MTNFLIPFLTGLTTGGLSCFALQGGLFSSLLLSSKDSTKAKTYAIFSFLGAKILAYSVLGFVLGLAGNFLTPSPKFSGILNLLVAGFMIGVALEALKVHTIFRYFLIQPPKFVRKLVKENAKKEGFFKWRGSGSFDHTYTLRNYPGHDGPRCIKTKRACGHDNFICLYFGNRADVSIFGTYRSKT